MKLSNNLTGIPDDAFEFCEELESINIPDEVKTIGTSAFYSCDNLQEIILPQGLQNIGSSAFTECISINEIVIPKTVLLSNGDCIFQRCSKLESVVFEEGYTGIIPYNAFYGCSNLKSVSIPNGVTAIYREAFANCIRLQEITIPASVTLIADGVFEGCDNLKLIKGYSPCSSAKKFVDDFNEDYPNNQIQFESIGTNEHTWDEGYIVKEPTTTEEGIMRYRCQVCNDTKDEPIPKLSDELIISNVNVKWIDHNSVEISFDSNKFAHYYIDWVNKGDAKPNFNPERIYEYETWGGNTSTNVLGLPESEVDIYICFQDSDQNRKMILVQPNYSNRPEPQLIQVGDNVYATVEGNTLTISGSGATYDFEEWNSWYNGDKSKIEEIIFDGDITYLGDFFFNGFISCTNINLPDSLNQFGSSIFLNCSSLEEIRFSASLVEINSDWKGDANLSSLKKVILPEGIKKVGESAFYNCVALEKIILPYGLNEIGEYAFGMCGSLKEITFPEGLTKLGNGALSECIRLEKINFPSTLVEIPNITYDLNWGTADLRNLTTVTIPNGVKEIGDDAFREAPSLTNIELPDTLKEIGNNAFDGCSSLENITLPEGLKKIGDNAFNGCTSLTEIILPEGLTQLGNVVFDDCSSLEKISFPSTLETIPQLMNCDSYDGLKEVVIADGIKYIGEYAFYGHRKLKNITLPENIVSVGPWAFWNSGLELIELPDSIDYIGDGAFQNCANLQTITIPEKNIIWGDSVFANTAVGSITWNSENPVIPSGIFAGCANLKDITIPEGVTAINNSAFADCTLLTNVSIPESVTELGDSAFGGCNSLEKISIPKTVKYFGNDVFYNCRNLTIYGYRDSMAERYANNNNIPFVSADYKVVFKNNGRTVKTEYVLEGNDATPPTLDPREGYTLSWDGDYTDIQEDMVINAVWTKNDDGDDDDDPPIIVYPPEETKYTVTFVDRGKVIKTEKVVSGEAADYPYIYRYGYSLEWDKDFSKVTSNMTVNAIWTVITPEKVTSLTAEVLPKSIRLSWDENEYTNYFLIYRKASNETKYTQVGKTPKVIWTDKTAKNGTEYQYKVAAVRAVAGKKYQSEDSDIVTAKLGGIEKDKIYSVGKLNYKVMNTKEVQVTGLAKLTGTVAIPSTVTIAGNVFKVTSIADKAFMQNTDIVNVRIGNGVTMIGQQAFYKCANLETVNLGSNVLYLRNGSFARCTSLKKINIPKSVKRIGIRAFYHCSNLSLVTIRTTRLEYIGKKALEIAPNTIIKVPEEKYNLYKKKIIQTGIYSGTKINKI